MGYQKKLTSEGFDVSLRNKNNLFHSSPLNQQKFNACNYTSLKNDSRFYGNLLEAYEHAG